MTPFSMSSVDLFATVAAARGIDDGQRLAREGLADDRMILTRERNLMERTLTGLSCIAIAVGLHALLKMLRLSPPVVLLAVLASFAAAPDAALAQQTTAVAPGMAVIGPQGERVGVVKGIKGDNLLIVTAKHETWLPRASFTKSRGMLLFALTESQLNAEIEKTIAAQASVVPGAAVKGLAGKAIGKIESVGEDSVVVVLPSGISIQAPRLGLRGNSDGSVTIGLTAEQVATKVSRQPEPAM